MTALELLEELERQIVEWGYINANTTLLMKIKDAIKEFEKLENKSCDGCKYDEKDDTYPSICKEEQVFNDWRLPTIKELKTLVNYNKYYPACDLEDTKSECYWSCLSYVSDSSNAWYVNFNLGYNSWSHKSYSIFVRCVRDGENGLEWSATSKNKMTWDEAIEYASKLVAPVYYKELSND